MDNPTTPPVAGFVPPQAPIAPQLPAEVVDELDKKAKRYGLRYSQLEEKYKVITQRPDIAKLSPPDQKRLVMMMINAECSRYADNPLADYEFFVIGTTLNDSWKNSKIICGSMIPGKDTPDTLDGKNFGIPTLVTNFDTNYLEVEKITHRTFWRANLTNSQPGVARREITSTVDTQFSPINHPEITLEQIQAWIDKKYPVQTLAFMKNNPSALVQPRKAGGKPFTDMIDLRRAVVVIKNVPPVGKRDDGTEFFQYTVEDDSLTDEERLNIKDASGKVISYGGVSMTVPRHLYKTLNLDVNSVIDVLFTARKTQPKQDGSPGSKVGIALDAVSIIPIVDIKKKTPVSQMAGKGKATPGQTGIQAFDLAAQ